VTSDLQVTFSFEPAISIAGGGWRFFMKVFLTGSSGFVGLFILQDLIRAGHAARCLVRSARSDQPAESAQIEYVVGDVTKPDTLEHALAGCDAVIHLVAIIRESRWRGITFESANFAATQNIVEAAKSQGVNRFLHMSALGADPQGITPYLRSKGRAEEYVRRSGLNYTIFRPSFIFGPGGGVYGLLAKMIGRSPFGLIPVFGSGEYKHQPVSIHNVSQGFLRALENPAAFNKTYDVGGKEVLAYRQQLDIIGRVIGKEVRKVPVPLLIARTIVFLMGRLPFSPIDSDQLKMLLQDNTCDPIPFSKDLGIELIPFEIGLEESLIV